MCAKFLQYRDGGKTDEKGISTHLYGLFTGEVINGMAVSQNSPLGMSVLVSEGRVMIDSGSDYPYLGFTDANEVVTITTADGSNPRIDAIVAYIDLSVVDSTNANNPGAFKIVAVAGTPAGSPSAPNSGAISTAIGSGNPFIRLANVTVGTGVTTITTGNVSNQRVMVGLSQAIIDATKSEGWETGLPTPNTVTYNGNRSYDLVFNSTDLTDTLSPGMRIRTSRTVAAPTQCTSLNGTTQYWVKTSPNKLTFTDDFVVSAWIKVSSYAQGAIVSRFNGTSGWELRLEATGQVYFVGFNAGGTNFSYVQSYQSVPLNKWVHVTAQLDMSSFTATTTTSYVMLDGKDVPCVVARGGTNPTALVQAGNLEIGSRNGGTLLFPGKIAQVAIYNAKVTQANIVATISQGLSGSETSLASAYSFNNSTADLNTSTPNDLVAGAGSPTATNADSPFALGNDLASAYTKGTTDFGVVMATSFSTNTTVTVQVPEGCTIPTSGGVTSVVYSGQRSPYGFPSNRNLWTVECINKYQVIQSSPTASTWYYTNLMLTTPIGAWKLGYELLSFGGKTASVFDHYVTLATSSATETSNAYTSVVTGYDTISSMQSRTGAVSLSSATPYYVNMKTSSSGVNNIQIVGIASYATGRIYAENAYV